MMGDGHNHTANDGHTHHSHTDGHNHAQEGTTPQAAPSSPVSATPPAAETAPKAASSPMMAAPAETASAAPAADSSSPQPMATEMKADHAHGHHTTNDGHTHSATDKVHLPEVHMKCHDKIMPLTDCTTTEVYYDMTENACKTREANKCGPADSKNKFESMSACMELCKEEITSPTSSETTTVVSG